MFEFLLLHQFFREKARRLSFWCFVYLYCTVCWNLLFLQKITYRMAEKGEGTEVTLLRSLDMRELQDEGKSMITKLADDLAKVCLFCALFFVSLFSSIMIFSVEMLLRIRIHLSFRWSSGSRSGFSNPPTPTPKKRTRIATQFLGLKLPFSYFFKIDDLQLLKLLWWRAFPRIRICLNLLFRILNTLMMLLKNKK